MSNKNCLILQSKSAIRPDVRAAVKAVIESGIDLRVRIPWDQEDNTVVIREACEAGAERIIAGGGDGTINAVTTALVGDGQTPPAQSLGVLPLGTANDFAHACGLPVDDLAECLRIACTAPPKTIDVGKMNELYFINVASLGFGAEVTATTPQQMKKALGGGAYTLMGLATALKFKPYAGRLLVPGQEPVEGQMLVAAVGNSRLAGGGFEVAPKASLSDGLLDLALISHDTEFRPSVVFKELDDEFNEKNRYVHYRQLAEFTIESEQKLHCNLDGEPVLKRKLNFSILPGHLQLATP